MEVLRVLKPGLLSTLQDAGRFGFRAFGVSVSGVLDVLSARCANFLLNNPIESTVLEITLQGPELECMASTALSLTGADLSPKLNGVPVKMYEPVFVTKGDRLSFGRRVQGARLYLGVRGGFQGRRILESQSTHMRSGWGGIQGGPVQVADVLSSYPAQNTRNNLLPDGISDLSGSTLRITEGPEFGYMQTSHLTETTWRVSSQSDRAGIRLQGAPIEVLNKTFISSPVDIGTIQLPKNGQPIVLLNDGASIGGYPRIASVILADLPRLVQIPPNQPVSFEWVSHDEASKVYEAFCHDLSKLVAS